MVESNNRLQDFLVLASDAKQTRLEHMLLEYPGELASKITYAGLYAGDVSALPLKYGTEEIIFASCRIGPHAFPGTLDFQGMVSDMGEVACRKPKSDRRFSEDLLLQLVGSNVSGLLIYHKTLTIPAVTVHGIYSYGMVLLEPMNCDVHLYFMTYSADVLTPL